MSYAVPVPATGPSAQPLANPITVVSPQFQATYPVDLVITEKMMTIKEGDFTVSDVNGNVMFQVKGSLFSLHDRRTLVDSAGTPILSFRQKIMTAHKRWHVFRGESSDEKDLLFTARKSSFFQLKTELDVFLAGNTKEEAYDFKVKGSWGERSCTIYNGDNTIIAQMHKKHDLKSSLFGRDAFSVTVYPHVDYAFITAIVIVLHEINMDRSGED
ncbi:protein LURP-one-related 15-like [Rosa sericea]|uniref:Putative tubby-like domain-containing protein n=1 Tax=Rosa chinensis TaxID=74649 RepID=A0A2P6R8K8_ROSCH|nr:protein LURP-one-related 15 [Rosa chinensis]XP_062005697.1 protein LURP-one-related 15-like [Rosa rugosa]PRQ42766.1 putative tubby-like domain-containing protein [Rosa chinensis]